MGIDRAGVFAVATGLAMAGRDHARALFFGMRANFDPPIGPARLILAFEAVIIGGLGSPCGARSPAASCIGLAQTLGALDQPGMADPRRPYRLPRRPGGQAARALFRARGGLRAHALCHDTTHSPAPGPVGV